MARTKYPSPHTASVVLLMAIATVLGAPNSGTSTKETTAVVTIDEVKPRFITNEKYFSLGMDVFLIREKWVTFNSTSARVITMAKALGPTYVRFSGGDADRMVFNKTIKPRKNGIGFDFPTSIFTMTLEDWDKINEFCLKVNWRVIFGLNEQLRSGDHWDPSNAMDLLDYSIRQGYSQNLDFELGNEPDSYGREGMVVVNGSQLAQDVQILRKLLNSPKYEKYYRNAMLVGPDIGGSSETFIRDFVNGAGDVISAMTFHQYYGGSRLNVISDYIDPTLMDTYINNVQTVTNAVYTSTYPYLKIWQGETATTYSPPGNDIDMSYVAGFMLLDKLGLSAALGVDLVVRQTFYGFWFALVDQGLHSTPDYWISLLFKRLVGREVLKTDVTVTDQQVNPRAVRFYAHCTKRGGPYPDGAVVLYGMNLLDNEVTLKLSRDYDVDQYLLTPGGWGGLTSRFIALNGQILFMPDETTLPELEPVALPAGRSVSIPSLTLGFFVLKNADASACKLLS